jgi:hypothetical protein
MSMSNDHGKDSGRRQEDRKKVSDRWPFPSKKEKTVKKESTDEP